MQSAHYAARSEQTTSRLATYGLDCESASASLCCNLREDSVLSVLGQSGNNVIALQSQIGIAPPPTISCETTPVKRKAVATLISSAEPGDSREMPEERPSKGGIRE